MKTFVQLYREITKDAVADRLVRKLEKLENEDYDKHQLECLLHPEKQPAVWKIKDCSCKDGKCIASCLFNAIEKVDGKITISRDLCVGCGECIDACENGSLVLSSDTVRAIELIKEQNKPVYALMAPAYIGQFGDKVTSGQMRTALKALGFAGMVEVAAFADILTLKEALEFDHNIKNAEDYQLTSCCCPVWISLIRKNFKNIARHLSHSVSPMIAAGRVVKQLFPESVTIFIGPCIAKKAEAKEPDLQGAIDCVITFQELRDIFEAAGLKPETLEDSVREHSSWAGRIYAKAGGVSRAVEQSAKRLHNENSTKMKVSCACGVKNCRQLLEGIELSAGEYNFFEGMGCVGGCIGGPKIIRPKEETAEIVEKYAENSSFSTPIDNPYVIDLLHRLGFETVEEFLEKSHILDRDFKN